MKFTKIKVEIIIPFILLFILLYSRFVGLNWGMPYPMHPDERNMAVAIGQMSCKSVISGDCLNPHFYAYGQFPLYLAYGIALLMGFFPSSMPLFENATLALRFISAIASVITVYFLIKTLNQLITIPKWLRYLLFLIPIFIPAFIQFAHFGTTESFLMMFYTLLIYSSIKLLKHTMSFYHFVIFTGITFGAALGTKVSAAVFGVIPFLAVCMYLFKKPSKEKYLHVFMGLLCLALITLLVFFLTSPYNFLSFQEFMGSMNYESDVGFGRYRAFYTRQFEYAIPFLFQLIRVFPYNLGWPVLILFFCGFIFLPFNKVNNFLRLQFLLFIIPNSIIYAKWSRFISPVFPLMVLMTLLIISQMILAFHKRRIISSGIILIITICAIIPGIAYLSIYINPDVRFEASKWIYTHMQSDSYILSETANVIDVPIPNTITPYTLTDGKSYKYISFNFYDIHLQPTLQKELEDHINKANYIFIPSRRVFANHTCYLENANGEFAIERNQLGYDADRCVKLRKDYTAVYSYYDRLFNKNLGFEKVAEFSSYPKISLFGKTLLEFPDEQAEETWTVFDHPVIRIYKRI